MNISTMILDFFSKVFSAFRDFGLKEAADVFLVTVVCYYIMRLMRDTKATQLAKGIIIIIGFYLFVGATGLHTMRYILNGALTLGLTTLVVVFQPELRRGLEQMGRLKVPFLEMGVFTDEYIKETEETINILVSACNEMAIKKTGALIVLERTTKLKDIMITGTMIEAKLTKELILNIFFINSPLHDGAVIISDNKIAAAGCYLPISADMTVSKELGTRHRAALGMSEESDAIVIVVSEESGGITVAINGKLDRGVLEKELTNILKEGLLPTDKENGNKKRFWRKKSNE